MKQHKFSLVVTSQSKEAARTAVLSAFASRQPDGCLFHLESASSDEELKDSFCASIDAIDELYRFLREQKTHLENSSASEQLDISSFMDRVNLVVLSSNKHAKNCAAHDEST